MYQLQRGRERQEVWCWAGSETEQVSWQAVVMGTIVLGLAWSYRERKKSCKLPLALYASSYLLPITGCMVSGGIIQVGFMLAQSHIHPSCRADFVISIYMSSHRRVIVFTHDLAGSWQIFPPSSPRWWYSIGTTLQIKFTLTRHLIFYWALGSYFSCNKREIFHGLLLSIWNDSRLRSCGTFRLQRIHTEALLPSPQGQKAVARILGSCCCLVVFHIPADDRPNLNVVRWCQGICNAVTPE